ncbi:scd6-like sm domain-containing protein [Phthorimaea operculella]|nr:scd6-like sm domain-containing protein [Phthorimaea operculella]
MSSGMPELGSKISLISKADIRYEGRLFTVDPQECTIALASVRSFGTEDRETQYPVAPQSQVYDYILFRGSDIKDIRVLNNVPSLPNDPAIMQMSVPPSLGGAPAAPGQFAGQFTHPVVGQTQYPQYHPMAGFPGGVHAQLNKTSELSPQTSVDLGQQVPAQGPIGSGVAHHANQVKDQGSMMDLLSGGGQNASRSGTPAVGGHRKSPTADQGTQSVNQHQGQHHQPGEYNNAGGYRGGWRGRGGRGGGQRGGGRGFVPRNKNTLKFDNDYDFEQANTEFEELRSQLAKAKISDAEPKIEQLVQVETEKKDDSGNETGAGEAGEEDEISGYDKNKSFFDNISCEAVERSKVVIATGTTPNQHHPNNYNTF